MNQIWPKFKIINPSGKSKIISREAAKKLAARQDKLAEQNRKEFGWTDYHTQPTWDSMLEIGKGIAGFRLPNHNDIENYTLNDSKRDAADDLLTAAKGAVVHLKACEAGMIHHPFKSASLPLLKAAIAKAEGQEVRR